MAVDLNYEKDSKERIPYEHYLEVYQNADPKRFPAGATFRMMRRKTGVYRLPDGCFLPDFVAGVQRISYWR